MKTKAQVERLNRLSDSLERLGFAPSEKWELMRIERTLHRWHEQECGDINDYCSWCITRGEDGKAYREVVPHTGKRRMERIADREGGALKRLAVLMAKHPGVWSYVQTDPRGCALYVGHHTGESNPAWLESHYSQGVAVCI